MRPGLGYVHPEAALIDYADALELILTAVPGPAGSEELPLARSSGRILAAPVRSDVDVPPFDKSAMDGFAYRAADAPGVPVTLPVVMEVAAGTTPVRPLEPGESAQVMTGAPVPAGADTVVQVEWTSGFGRPEVTLERLPPAGANISPQGEITSEGQVVLRPGVVLRAEEIGLLASAGADPVRVWRRPRIAILSTGDEVVAPARVPGPGQIRDANSAALAALVEATGCEAVLLGVVPDNPTDLAAAVAEGLQCDALVLSGGVSAGTYDFAQDVLQLFDLEIHFSQLAVKPGRPTTFASGAAGVVFGLPGNPASAVVVAQILATPALRRMAGRSDPGPTRLHARLGASLRKKPDRLWMAYATVDWTEAGPVVHPVRTRGAADLAAGARATCYIVAPRELSSLGEGDTVEVVLLERTL